MLANDCSHKITDIDEKIMLAALQCALAFVDDSRSPGATARELFTLKDGLELAVECVRDYDLSIKVIVFHFISIYSMSSHFFPPPTSVLHFKSWNVCWRIPPRLSHIDCEKRLCSLYFSKTLSCSLSHCVLLLPLLVNPRLPRFAYSTSLSLLLITLLTSLY